MRFALLGDHPDGFEMARALAGSGRHEIAVYSGPSLGLEYLGRWLIQPRRVGDLEEVLADPSIEAVIVAGSPAHRPGQLRRSVQSERHVLCVCPVDDSPDVAYEAAMAQADARTGGRVPLLLPLLAEGLHPGCRRLAELARSSLASFGGRPSVNVIPTAAVQGVSRLDHKGGAIADRPQLQALTNQSLATRLVEIERCTSEEILLDWEEEGHKPGLPGWDVLRLIGGEIAEVFVLSGPAELQRGQPLLLAGQFARGGLFQATYLPLQAEPRLRVALVSRESRAELVFAEGWPGPGRLSYVDERAEEHVETWGAFDPWTALVSVFEAALQTDKVTRKQSPNLPLAELTWQDAIRGLELDDAARRSVQRRRASTLEYQEATEEAGFKGTMTLIGCSMLWISLMLLILSAWLPWLGWVIAPVFGIFLVLQLLRWLVPGEPKESKSDDRMTR
jgi:hypothetical protein